MAEKINKNIKSGLPGAIKVINLMPTEVVTELINMNIKEARLTNERQIYAEQFFLTYQEYNGKIYLLYDGNSYIMPVECCQFKAFKLVTDELVKILKPVESKSRVPKNEEDQKKISEGV